MRSCRRSAGAGATSRSSRCWGSRAQVSASVAWQANAIAAIAIVIGIPVGIAAGQLAWRLFANQLGVPARPAVSAIALVIVVVATLVLANLTALIPARLAARTRAVGGAARGVTNANVAGGALPGAS